MNRCILSIFSRVCGETVDAICDIDLHKGERRPQKGRWGNGNEKKKMG